jgi:N6-L-threonylcarbamoyladenine synthase
VILGLETSCDDTCAAVVDRDGRVSSNVVSSQGVHDRFGGVVPEIASRHHLEAANVVVDSALSGAGVGWEAIDTVAVTQGPGLIGALLVGLSCAKGLAAARRLPLVGVDHLQGHVSANFLEPDPLDPPFLCLVASGGHTFLAHVRDHTGYEVLGQTLDDAAGEAIDKGARLLGLPFPGGPALERLAAAGDPGAFVLPGGRTARAGRSRPFDRGLDFSFAGLKTALLYLVRELGEQETARRRPDLAASYQRAVVEALTARVERGLERTGLEKLALGGGVAANGVLRKRLAGIGAALHVPARELCTDNAAMIAGAARFESALAYPAYLGLDAYPTGASAPLTPASAR